jgi:hypothetical protein
MKTTRSTFKFTLLVDWRKKKMNKSKLFENPYNIQFYKHLLARIERKKALLSVQHINNKLTNILRREWSICSLCSSHNCLPMDLQQQKKCSLKFCENTSKFFNLQWWSIFSTQQPQTEQWWARSGFTWAHLSQYLIAPFIVLREKIIEYRLF